MIEPIPDLAGGVIGFTVSGAVSREEYVDVLLPAMQRALEASGVRLAIVSDADWVRHAMAVFGWMVPREAPAFSRGELDEVKAWLAS